MLVGEVKYNLSLRGNQESALFIIAKPKNNRSEVSNPLLFKQPTVNPVFLA